MADMHFYYKAGSDGAGGKEKVRKHGLRLLSLSISHKRRKKKKQKRERERKREGERKRERGPPQVLKDMNKEKEKG